MSFGHNHHIPTILEVNAPLIEEQKRYRGLIDEAGAESITRRCFEDASLIVTVSEQVAKFVSTYPEASGKVHVLPNGVNLERFEASSKRALCHHEQFTIGFVGTLKPWHGVENLLQAFAVLAPNYSHARLRIVGDGPMRTELEKLTHQLRIAHKVCFTGAVAPEKMADELAKMQVGVAPYPHDIDCYFSPLKIFEYMAAGMAVVASDVGQNPDVIDRGASGFLYPAADISQLSEAIEKLILDPHLTQAMGQRGVR